MLKLLPKEVEILQMFINNKNKNCIELANHLNFNRISEERILKFEKDDIDKVEGISLTELPVGDYEDMKQLHNESFPNTYYSGEEIIVRLNNNKKVFIYKEKNRLVGYIYVEAEPEFGDGNIEYFAVSESYRGKGIGVNLLIMALKWLFSFDSINNITLCVSAENDKAINLYERIGFKLKHQLSYFIKKL